MDIRVNPASSCEQGERESGQREISACLPQGSSSICGPGFYKALVLPLFLLWEEGITQCPGRGTELRSAVALRIKGVA